MTYTNNISLNLLQNHQIHKEILINENFIITDAMMFNGVESMVSKLPDEAKVGAKYIVTNSRENPEKNDYLAIRMDGYWRYVEPKAGMMFWVIDQGQQVVFADKKWLVHSKYMMHQCSK